MGTNRWHKFGATIAVLVLAVGVSSCTAGNSDSEGDNADIGFQPKPVINLVVNDWTASAINVAIAEQIIERELGFPVVPTRMDDTTEMYKALADGDLDATLEVWPSTIGERDSVFFARGDVLDYGPLGVVGQIGWFVPAYVVEQYPELATWEGLQSRADIFATSGTEPKGRFVGTDVNYRQYDKTLMASLSLPFVVEFTGSEEATMAELAEHTQAQKPILLWWWTPTAAIGTHNLVQVELPEATAECVAAMESVDTFQEVVPAAPGGFACGYPEDLVFKAGNGDLAQKAPEVDRFIRAFSLTSEDQVELLEAVESRGKSINQAAQDWIDANEQRWRPWLDQPPETSD